MTPKVLVFMLVLLSDHLSPSGMLAFLSLEPYKRVREHFRGWGLDPKVQSPNIVDDTTSNPCDCYGVFDWTSLTSDEVLPNKLKRLNGFTQ